MLGIILEFLGTMGVLGVVVIIMLIVRATIGMVHCMRLYEQKKDNKRAFRVEVHIPVVLAFIILLLLIVELTKPLFK